MKDEIIHIGHKKIGNLFLKSIFVSNKSNFLLDLYYNLYNKIDAINYPYQNIIVCNLVNQRISVNNF